MTIAQSETLFDEITDFLVAQPSPEQIIAYQASTSLQGRLNDLLDKNANAELTPDERSELDQFLQFNHLLILLKAKARLRLL